MTLVLVALVLSTLIGFAGLAVETGLWYTVQRVNQSAADEAALSAAAELAGEKSYSDVCTLAKIAAAQANSFPLSANWSCPANQQASCNNPSSGQMCVNNPPLFGANTGNSNAVEVILAQQQNSLFSLPWLSGVTISTRAVAGTKAFQNCMLALQPSGSDLINSGNATLTLNDCSFTSESTDQQSILFNGNVGNVTMTAAAIDTAGGYTISGNSNFISPPITTHAAPVSDPYAGQITYTLPVGAVPQCAIGGTTLVPGLYNTALCAGTSAPMNFSAGTTTLCSGIYYLDGEDIQGEAFIVSGNGTVVNMGTPGLTYGAVTCPTTQNGNPIPLGVTIIATCSGNCSNGGGFIVGGTGTPTVNLAAPASAVPANCTQPSAACIPAEILFYQPAATADISQANPGNSILAGGSGVSLNGVIYTPSTQIGLNGNPQFGSCTELIAATYNIAGTPTMNAPNCNGIITTSATTVVLME